MKKDLTFLAHASQFINLKQDFTEETAKMCVTCVILTETEMPNDGPC